MEIGQSVTYVDENSKPHLALITNVFGPGDTPSVNVVYVSDDETQSDSYGRQIVRQTSCIHQGNQAAPGRYWKAN